MAVNVSGAKTVSAQREGHGTWQLQVLHYDGQDVIFNFIHSVSVSVFLQQFIFFFSLEIIGKEKKYMPQLNWAPFIIQQQFI